MKQSRLGRVVLFLAVCGAASASQAQVQVFTDEAAYRAALAAAGRDALSEGFEGAVWDGVRSTIAGGTSTAPAVTSQGITWTASAGVTTNDLGPRSGTWRGYDHPGGAPDRLSGTSAATLYGVGGWFTANILPSNLRVFIGGVSPDNATLALSTGYQFLGVVDPAGFTAFELVGDGAAGDEKHWFADDFTFGVAAGAPTNQAPNGTITQPATDVTAVAGESVTFSGAVSDPEGDAVTVSWNFGDGATSTLPSAGAHAYSTAGTYTVTFTATDVHGLSDPTPDQRTITIRPPGGIAVNPASGLVTTESGGTAGFSVVLVSQPSADVVVGVSSSDTTEGTVSPASLTFTSINWSTPQTVTVTGVDDAVVDGDVAYAVVTAAAVSSDPAYKGLNAADVAVTNQDNDAAGIVVDPTAGLVTTESGGADSFTVVLLAAPTAPVTIALSSSDPMEGTVAPASLVFGPDDWNVVRSVTVTGVDDGVPDGDAAYTVVTAPAVSADPAYQGLDAADVSATNTANKPPQGTIVLPADDVTVEAGSSVTFAGHASDPDGDAVTAVWDFGDGASSGLVSPGGHVFESPGVYTVTFTATDAHGLADPDPDSRTVTVAGATPAVAGMVPGVADVRGLYGSDWHTDVWVHNAGSTDVAVTLHYAAKGDTPGFDHPLPLVVSAGQTRRLTDVVAEGFGLSGTSGTLLYEVSGGDAAAVIVRGDTYNRLNLRERYGQNLPGIPAAGAATAGVPLFLPGLQDAVQYRYNLGVQSAGARRARVRVLDGETGAVLHDAEVAVPLLGWTQLVDLQTSFQLGSASGWYLEVTGLDGAVAASGNLIDQRSNDSINIAGRVLRAATASLWLSGAASTPGYLGSRWRSDLFSINAGPAAGQAELTFFPRDSGGGSAVAPVTLAYSGGQQLVVEDLVGATLGLPDGSAGAVSLRQGETSELLHLLRTYNEAVDTEGQRSTYGSAMTAVGEDELLGAGEEGRIVGVVDDADTRANLTLLNARRDAAGAGLNSEVEIELLAGDGSSLFREKVVLLPFQNIQINRFPERYLGSGIAFEDATLVVRPLGFAAADTGGVMAAVSVVNGNRTQGVGTSDPQMVLAVKRPLPSAATSGGRSR